MKRKIIRQGHNTLTITLPAKWAKKNDIKAGDEIELEENNKSVILKKSSGKESKKILKIDLKSEDYQFIRLILNNLYRRNIDILRINFKTDKQFEYIQEISNSNFLGFEVIEKEKDFCVLENITEPQDMSISVLTRRILLIIKETLIFLETDLIKKEHHSYNYVLQQSRKIEQFDNFCKRLIYKGKIENAADSYFYWVFLYYLLLIGRAFFHMYEYINQKKRIRISKELITVLANVRKGFELFYESFYKKDINGIEDSNKEIKSILYNDVYELFSQVKGKEGVIVFWIAEITRLISLFISPSIEICLCRNIEEEVTKSI